MSAVLRRLPLVTLYLTDRCNSRCITCDYWRHGRLDASLESVERLLPELIRLQTKVALLSGGEPLLNPQWHSIADLLRRSGLTLWLLTSGVSLAKHARRAAASFDAITVSLDGADRETYAAIRGLDAFDNVCEGIRSAVAAGAHVSVRVTVQRANYRQLSAIVDLVRELGAMQVSFLAIDVANPHAFARTDAFAANLALAAEDLPGLEQQLRHMEEMQAEAFDSGFIAESPAKLRRILQYFTALCGGGSFPVVRCNAPQFSAVIGAAGSVQPCFFIPGPEGAPTSLEAQLNSQAMLSLREDIGQLRRPECARCVCSMWRDPATFERPGFPGVLGRTPASQAQAARA